ncbi:MAG: hypothetical protein LBV07_05270, partial [Syntrophobacterales bacterium]|nr:hypothetical protein [Syntrophobacterales bacterium]
MKTKIEQKPFILYCDDDPEEIKKFKTNHGNRFEIETLTGWHDFELKLEELIAQGKIPDIILIDLFHPKHDDESIQVQRNIEAKEALDQLKENIAQTKKIVESAWLPHGLEMLEQAGTTLKRAREQYHNRDIPVPVELEIPIPIAIYTKQGISLVDDRELEYVATHKGKWILKGRSLSYESVRLMRMWKHLKESR